MTFKRVEQTCYRSPADEPGEIIVVYTPGGGYKFYEEFGPIARSGPPDPKVLAPLFEKHEMTLLGSPLSLDSDELDSRFSS